MPNLWQISRGLLIGVKPEGAEGDTNNLMSERAIPSKQREATAANGQEAVIAFLSDPTSYAATIDRVERIDTHAAFVFLAGNQAYKIKRAIKLPYLDFSTLEKRARVCEREVEINSRTAPELYLGVIPITRDPDGRLCLGGEGEPVEWAIVMERFDQDCLLDHMAAKGELDLALIAKLAEHIAAFHAAAEPDPDADGVKVIANVVGDTVSTFEAAGDVLPADAVERYGEAIHGALAGQSDLLRQRAKRGYVRLCHGDLHLRNIVLLQGEPTLFDAIEFDDEMATIDVLYDLAFLLMDLWHRGLKPHANLLNNLYLARAGEAQDLAGLAALPLFLSCRAAVRAMVGLHFLPNVAAPDRAETIQGIQGYFELAGQLLQPEPPRLVAVGGLSGAGKSTLGMGLAPGFGAVPGALHLRSDVERKRLFRVKLTDRLGQDAYRPAVNARVYHELNRRAKAALEAGQSVLVDAVFLRAEERANLQAVADDLGVPFSGIWLSAPEDVLLARVAGREGDASDATPIVVKKQLSLPTGPISWAPVEAGGPPEAVIGRSLNVLEIEN